MGMMVFILYETNVMTGVESRDECSCFLRVKDGGR